MNGTKGCSPSVPNKVIQKRAVQRGMNENFYAISVNEAYTTKRSSCCHGYDMKYMTTSHKQYQSADGTLHNSKVNGICFCQNCHRLHSRDMNASKNIWHLGYNVTKRVLRPRHLYKFIIQ